MDAYFQSSLKDVALDIDCVRCEEYGCNLQDTFRLLAVEDNAKTTLLSILRTIMLIPSLLIKEVVKSHDCPSPR